MHSTEKAGDTTLDDEKYDSIDIIEWCNNTHQRAPHTGKQMSACTSDLSNGSHVTCYICHSEKMLYFLQILSNSCCELVLVVVVIVQHILLYMQ